MSLVPDEIPETAPEPNTLSLYEALKSATSNMHYWYDARQRDADAAEQAARGIATADKYIADYTEKMNEALTKLGFLNAPDAEVSE